MEVSLELFCVLFIFQSFSTFDTDIYIYGHMQITARLSSLTNLATSSALCSLHYSYMVRPQIVFAFMNRKTCIMVDMRTKINPAHLNICVFVAYLMELPRSAEYSVKWRGD